MTVTHAVDGPLYRQVPGLRPDGRDRWVNRDGEAIELTPVQGQVMRQCRQFRAIAELGALPGFTDGDLRRLEAGGLLESDASILRQCADQRSAPPAEPLRDLGILACASPELLRRSIDSWLAMIRRHRHEPRVTVVDDSPDAGAEAAQREASRSLAAGHGVDLQFIGPTERRRFATDLARAAGLEPELTEFLVNGCAPPRVGIGASRNVLNLLTTGRRVLSADDDVVAKCTPVSTGGPALWLISGQVPADVRFFESAAESGVSAALDLGTDIVAWHDRIVGHSIGNLLERWHGPASLLGAGPSLTGLLQREPVRIAVTSVGLIGDSASDCAAFFNLIAEGETGRRFLARPTPLPDSRETWHAPICPVFGQGASLMTYCHAFDNTLPLPPFFPLGRGEDQVWQKLLHRALPATLSGHLPFSVLHRPLDERRYRDADYLDPCAVFEANAFLLGLLGDVPSASPDMDAAAAYAATGRALRQRLGPQHRFASLVRTGWEAYLLHHRTLVSQSLARYPGRPPDWQYAVRGILERLEAQLADAAGVPLVYGSRHGSAALAPLHRDLCRFAELIEHWPAIRSCAGDCAATLARETG